VKISTNWRNLNQNLVCEFPVVPPVNAFTLVYCIVQLLHTQQMPKARVLTLIGVLVSLAGGEGLLIFKPLSIPAAGIYLQSSNIITIQIKLFMACRVSTLRYPCRLLVSNVSCLHRKIRAQTVYREKRRSQ
jgi:hypothetical protein